MRDALGWRFKFGVVTPSVNTCIQAEFDAMRPPGVTNHISRMYMRDAPIEHDEGFHAVVKSIDDALEPALESVMTAEPDHLILGVSIEAIWGGLEGSQKINERIARYAGGISATTASEAIPAALQTLKVGRKVALLSPYRPPGVAQVKNFLGEVGYEVVRARSLPHEHASKLGHFTAQQLVDILLEIDGDDIDGIVQFGANVANARVAGEAERWLHKPVICVNTALYWHALRSNGLNDIVEGFGALLERH